MRRSIFYYYGYTAHLFRKSRRRGARFAGLPAGPSPLKRAKRLACVPKKDGSGRRIRILTKVQSLFNTHPQKGEQGHAQEP